MKGPTGVVVAKDAIAAAKLLAEFAKENDSKPSIKGGLWEGKAVDEATVKKLASMRPATRRCRSSSARSTAC